MNSTMTLTPDCNIDYDKMRVINEEKISKRTFRSTEEVNIYDLEDGKEKIINVISISLYTNLLILDGEKYKILNMSSKSN